MRSFVTDMSIYTKDNKYGYTININNPVAHKLYRAYLKKHNIPERIGLSDPERADFEGKVGEMIRRRIIVVEKRYI